MADVVVVGAGAAGWACASELRDRGFDGSVVVVGRELDPPYDRTLVSKGLLVGSVDDPSLSLPDVELRVRTAAMKLDTEARVLKLASGELAYGKLVLCPGANVRRLRVDGAALDGIHYLRAPGNAAALRADAAGASRAVIVGGSFIGCEVAAALSGMGVSCTQLMLEDAPMVRAFGPTAAGFVSELLRSHGVEVVTSATLAGFEGEERVAAAVLEDGRSFDADLVVMGTGAVPDVMLARAGGLELGETGGIRCDAQLRTSAPDVWAAGDAAEFDGTRIEHWEVALAQGRLAARNVLGAGESFTEVPYFWTDLGDWATLEYVGWGRPFDREEVRGDPASGSFSVFLHAGPTLVGAVTSGRAADLDEARARLAP